VDFDGDFNMPIEGSLLTNSRLMPFVVGLKFDGPLSPLYGGRLHPQGKMEEAESLLRVARDLYNRRHKKIHKIQSKRETKDPLKTLTT
jgi:hypothetical protein